MTTYRATRTATTKLGGLCVASGMLGLVLAISSVSYPPAVPESQWSYPFPAGLMLAVSILLAVSHLLTLAGFVGVQRANPHRRHRVATIGLQLAIAGLALLAASELASGTIGSGSTTSPTAVLVSSAFGIASLANALGCILAGIVIVRAEVWRGLGRWMVLGSGLILVLLVTPANIIGNEVLRMAALSLWSATFIPLGATISRSSATADKVDLD